MGYRISNVCVYTGGLFACGALIYSLIQKTYVDDDDDDVILDVLRCQLTY